MHDLVVMSDLHLGKGLDPESGLYHRLETFFYDDDFKRFCRYLIEEAEAYGTPFRLVLNGDVFDLLRIDFEEPDERSKPRERRFGPTLTPAVAARTVGQILAGHPVFVEALALVVAAGQEVILLPGNHDQELQWAPAQAEVRRAVLARVSAEHGPEAVEAASARLIFKPWFHYEPGRIWIEHGCQYDPENAFRYPLRGALVDTADELFHAEQDMPFGNFIQRYLYNEFGNITFIVPSTRANARYIKWLLLNEPRLLVHVIASHVPFAVQLIRRMARAGGAQREKVALAHRRELTRLAEESGLGSKLEEIAELKHVGADVVRVGGEIARQVLRLVGLGSAILLLGAALWAMGSQAIAELKLGLAPKAFLSVALNSLMIAVLASSTLYWALRVPRGPPARPIRGAARRIAELLQVPLVTFGHTHDEVISRLVQPGGEKGWYFNTGTWIAVFTHDALLPRDRVQFTFLRVRGTEGELLQWSPGRGEAMPVILLDERSALDRGRGSMAAAPGG